MNTTYLVFQVSLATAMMVGAIAGGGFLLRQSSIRRRSVPPAASNRERGSNLQYASDTEVNVDEVAKVGERVLAIVKPIALALRDLNKRVAELQARVDVSEKMLTKLASPIRRETPSAQKRKRVDTQAKESVAMNAKERELAEQVRVLRAELATLKRVMETPKPKASSSEKPGGTSPVEKPITSRPTDTQKLAALLRVITN